MVADSLITANIALAQRAQDQAINAAAANAAASNIDLKAIEGAAQEFEAVFITEMMKPMFEGIETNGTFGGGKGEEVFNGFMLQEYGKIMAETSSFGIADHVKAAMIQMQEQANAASAPASISTSASNSNSNTNLISTPEGDIHHDTTSP